MISVPIEVELTGIEPLQKWFGEAVEGKTTENAIPGATLTLQQVESGVGFLDSTTATVILNFLGSIATGILANALYDGSGKFIRHLRINGVAVRNTPQAIEEELKKAVAAQGDSAEKPPQPAPSKLTPDNPSTP